MPERVGEFLQPVQARCRFGGGLGVAGLPEQSDRGAQFPEGGAAGLPDMGQGGLRLVGAFVHEVGGDPGLDVDQRDVVRHHVVQIPGDPQPLLGDPAAGLLVAGAFGPLGAFPDGVHEGPAAADRVPAAAAIPVHAKTPRFSCAYQGMGPDSMAAPVRAVMVSSPTRQVVGRSVCAATVYSATTALIATGALGSLRISSSRDIAVVTQRTGRGARRRSARVPAASGISTRPRTVGVRVSQLVGPCLPAGPFGSSTEPTSIAARTATARALSVAVGWAISQPRRRLTRSRGVTR